MAEEYGVEAVLCGIAGDSRIIRGSADKQIVAMLDQNAQRTGGKHGFARIQIAAVQVAGNNPESLSPVRGNENVSAVNVVIGIRILLTDFFQNR